MGVGRIGQYYGDFKCLTFKKRGRDIIDKTEILIKDLKIKIEDREQRIASAAKEAGMDTAMDVLTQIQHLSNPHSNQDALTVGIAAKVKKEVEARLVEVTELEKLTLVARNLNPEETFTLGFAEIEYFGF
jgi:gluconate kinase